MVDFRVVPEALRSNVKELDEVADAWHNAKGKLDDIWMPEDALGLLGGAAPARHNAALSEVIQRLGEGYKTLNSAAEALKAVADTYAAKDEEFYRKYGYLNERKPR